MSERCQAHNCMSSIQRCASRFPWSNGRTPGGRASTSPVPIAISRLLFPVRQSFDATPSHKGGDTAAITLMNQSLVIPNPALAGEGPAFLMDCMGRHSTRTAGFLTRCGNPFPALCLLPSYFFPSAITGTNFWIRLACSTSPVYMLPCLSVPIALIQWNCPAYLPLRPKLPSVLPVAWSRIHTTLFVPSATYIYFCSGSFENTIL